MTRQSTTNSVMANYLLKNIDPELYARVQARAEQEGATIRYVLLRLLEHYAAYGLLVRPGQTAYTETRHNP